MCRVSGISARRYAISTTHVRPSLYRHAAVRVANAIAVAVG